MPIRRLPSRLPCRAETWIPPPEASSQGVDLLGPPRSRLLRPPELLEAREDRAEERITPAELRAIEDRAVGEAIALQEEAGLEVVTDGEMRRLSFQSQMAQAVEGFGEVGLDSFLWGDWHGDEAVGERRQERPAAHGAVAKLVASGISRSRNSPT